MSVAVPHPFFLDTDHGRLFAVHHVPQGDIWGHVLVVPPFNEELNRSRSMLTLQAQALAEIGMGSLVVDLFGTGESDGDYEEAHWTHWQSDLKAAIVWLNARSGGCRAVLGVRLGALLAAGALAHSVFPRPALVLWQPVIDGKSYFTQFLRIRLAANLDRSDIPKENTNDLRARLAAGEIVEIAGYSVHPGLAAGIEASRLADLVPTADIPIAWFEKGVGPDGGMTPASEKLLEEWRATRSALHVETFSGEAFWALHDRAIAGDLIRSTCDWLLARRGDT